MRCEICGKSDDEANLKEGISQNRIITVCDKCAELENIPLIEKPSSYQLEQADRQATVRERMEKLSGMDTPVSKDQEVASKHLAKLRIPPKKQNHPDLLENYDWKLKMARRKQKLSCKQLAEQTGISQETIQQIERGILPDNFHDIMKTLEGKLNIQLLSQHAQKISFKKHEDEEKKILQQVEEKMNQQEQAQQTEHNQQDKSGKTEKIERMQKGELDFSKDNLNDITLKDLQDAHYKKQKENMFGDDVEIDE
ncbi:MAG: helix-turn-helix domain-containing protein [Candidatus Nanoarchaeia archaeon]